MADPAPRNTSQRSRKWIFTLNNYTDEEEEALQAWDSISYLVYGYEEAPTTGTPHLQGFVVFRNAVSFKTWKNKVPRASVRIAYGNAEENFNYTTKDGYFHEQGTRPKTRRKGIKVAECAANLTERQFLELDPNVPELKLYDRHRTFVQRNREPPTVYWFWGESGTGKTRKAATDCADHDHYWVPPDARWFPGYDGHSHVIMDELRGQFRISTLLMLLDRYPMKVEFKGGHTNWTPTHIYITSPYSPAQYMRKYHPGEELAQLERRITHVERFQHDPIEPDREH